ncbi:MAG: hypothetical protein GY778_14255 [bacterium]|nr:hypothetical protein [bacterium]
MSPHRAAPTVLIVVTFGALLLAWTGPACGPEKVADSPEAARFTPKPALHALHSQRIAEVMADLDAGTLDRLPQELDAPAETTHHLAQIQKLSQELAETASYIPDALLEDDLSDDDHELFVMLSNRLQRQARHLGDCAPEGNVALVEDLTDQIDATCDACHNLFREVPPLTD